MSVRGKELDDGFEVDGLVLAVRGLALGATVLEKFLVLGGSDELHVFGSDLGRPQRSVHRTDGPRRSGVERSSSMPNQHGSRQHRP